MAFPILLSAACSDGTGVQQYVGFYDMTQFAGAGLPSGDGTIFIRSAVIELRSGGRFKLDMERDYRLDGEWILDPVSHSGNYTIDEGALTMYTQAGPLTGAIFPTYIRLNDGTNPSIWVKRE